MKLMLNTHCICPHDGGGGCMSILMMTPVDAVETSVSLTNIIISVKKVVVVHHGRCNNKCILICLVMQSLKVVNRDVSTAYC